jgi:CubicO group peptidase (beta-lactamase class C family)
MRSDHNAGWRLRLCVGLFAVLPALLLIALCLPAHAQSSAAIAIELDASVKGWMVQHHVNAASLAAMKDGKIVKSFGYGGSEPDQPARIASLSKAITAVCVARLIDGGRLAFSAPLGTVLASAFAKFGEPVDPRFKVVTIEQLLMHRSGFAREPRLDGAPPHDVAEGFMKALATPLIADPGNKMSYSNVGYQTLGMVVETITGASYERNCRSAALEPMQASGKIDPVLRGRSPNGGWLVSAIDYAKFVQVFDSKTKVLGEVSRAWMDSRREIPTYSLGTFMRRTARGVTYQHDGKVALREGGGSYSIKFDNGWTIVVMFDGNHNTDVYLDLGRRLETAVVKR